MNTIPSAEPASLNGPTQCPIVLACDEAFAMPLATMLRSLVDSNLRHWPLDVTVLHDGYSDQTRLRVEQSLPHGAAVIRWQLLDPALFDGFTPMSYVSRMTYARLQMDQYFGPSVGRLLYLDADMLVLDDIGPLMNAELHGRPVGAVPDEFIDHAIRIDQNSGRDSEIAGVPKVGRYFNAGMLLIDLPAWRQASIGERALEYLVLHPSTPYADQDALNAVCDGQWAVLPGRWNYQGHVKNVISRLGADQRPAIAHFITAKKPWKPESASINAALYGSYWDKTAFRRDVMQRLRWSGLRFVARARNKFQRTFG